MTDKIIYRGPGLMSLLFLLFIYLKLTGVISWSWWLVTTPLWAPLVFSICIALIILFGCLVIMIISAIMDK